MRHRNPGRTWVAAGLVVSLVLMGGMVKPPAASAAIAVGVAPGNPCLAAPEDVNHANIRLDEPADGTRVPVDDRGKITVSGVLHKQANMDDLSVGSLVTTAFTFGPPPDGVSDWAASWTTDVRPPHLGPIQLCARAERDPKWQARILRNVTVVDLIPPSDVPNLAASDITSSSAKVSWGEATDNYGLAGYEVTVDGGTAVRTAVGTRSYAITGLSPLTDHTVSVVAVDLAGNRSTTPATVSFTTTAPPPPPPPTGVTIDAQEGYAVATWHPDPTTDATYSVSVDGVGWEDFPLDLYCQDANGNPANPCTDQDVISYSISDLDDGTPYTVQIQALAADGTQARVLSATFTTLSSPLVVPEATTALIASDSTQCAAMGGRVYVSPSVRGQVSPPAGSTQIFEGCYRVANSGCIDGFLPPSGNNVITCTDDVTNLMYSVAPPGRGPVISSMEAVANFVRTPSLAPSPVIEPTTWCPAPVDQCVIIFQEAAEAAEAVAGATIASAIASFLVVAAEGIGLGIALFTILSLLFPTEINLAGFLEYPISPDTDFDTFNNWGLDQGKWYNDLKIYAEVIKTTMEVAQQQGIPFVWTDDESNQLKTNIDLGCSTQRGQPDRVIGCDDNVVVYVPGGTNYRFQPMQETSQHIASALDFNKLVATPAKFQWYYPARSLRGVAATSAGFRRNWYDTAAFKPNACENRDMRNTTCDEFPFFSTNQAVNLSGVVADVLPVPRAEQNPQGQDIGGFYRQCAVNDGDHFIVLPVQPWIAVDGPSFGFRVNQDGVNVCMPPRVPTP